MSTLTRRACYKCGNVGHYAGEPDNLSEPFLFILNYGAEVCSSSERLCYNCESLEVYRNCFRAKQSQQANNRVQGAKLQNTSLILTVLIENRTRVKRMPTSADHGK